MVDIQWTKNGTQGSSALEWLWHGAATATAQSKGREKREEERRKTVSANSDFDYDFSHDFPFKLEKKINTKVVLNSKSYNSHFRHIFI